MFPCTPPAESARSNIAYLGMISQCLLIHNLLEGLKKVHSRCALLILGKYSPLYHGKKKWTTLYVLYLLRCPSPQHGKEGGPARISTIKNVILHPTS
ncbi:uncharacterized protein LOC143231324 isoform X3 [Tachypleus tridentatus]|uniref:uncharacterized protein LOC143231324 isoform X3 n=1 Tax=Tachypleus tridentatus TaxID=6853 RepID=UPI003FD314BD